VRRPDPLIALAINPIIDKLSIFRNMTPNLVSKISC
jgi:hypothetical protein